MKRTWAEIALSAEWESFWNSKELRQIRETTQRLLNTGYTLDARTIARLQSRLQVLDEIEVLPRLMADRDAATAQEVRFTEESDAEQALDELVRIR